MSHPVWSIGSIGALLVFASAAPALADDISAESTIDSVLVFPYSADITRLGEIAIPAGDHRVIVRGLPRSVAPDSLRVRFGSDAIVVGAVEASAAFAEGGGPEQAQALRDELQALRDQMQAVDDRIATAELQFQFLQTQAAAPKSDGDGLSPIDWSAALQAIEAGGLAARAVVLEARQERRELERRAQEIELQLGSWSDDLSLRTDVQIALTAERAVTAPFQLEYQVQEAGWAALYEARLDSEAASMALERKIKVFQNTGEDWTSVQLSVSTAPPSAQLAAPSVYAPRLILTPPAPPPAPAPVMAAGEAYAEDERADLAASRMRREDFASEAPRLSANLAIDAVNASFASSYSVGGRVDVPSNNTERTFTIGQEDVAVDLVIRTAPRSSLEAFVTAKLTYDGEGPLPAGALRKYRDGAYLREDWLDTLVPGEEVELGFGVDEAIVVSWVDESKGAGEAGLMGRNRVVDQRHRFEALNRHDQPFTVEIVDFRPIPQDDDITVRVAEDATPPDEDAFEDRPGVLAWRRTLAPGEALSVINAYSISHPSGEVLFYQ